MFSFVSLAPSPGGSKSIEFDRDVLRGVIVKSGILREESRYCKLPVASGKGNEGERVFDILRDEDIREQQRFDFCESYRSILREIRMSRAVLVKRWVRFSQYSYFFL